MQILIWAYQILKTRGAAVVLIYTAATTLVSHLLGVFQAIEGQLARVDALAMPAMDSAGISLAPLSLANYFLPLDLGVSLFAAWVALWLLCAAIRIVKAWIPTVS